MISRLIVLESELEIESEVSSAFLLDLQGWWRQGVVGVAIDSPSGKRAANVVGDDTEFKIFVVEIL